MSDLYAVPDDQHEQIVTSFPAGMFNNLEQAIAQQVQIEFLQWLRRIRQDKPANMIISGKSVSIGFPKNHLTIDFHEGDCRRPKRLRWQVSITLQDYKANDAEQEALL